MFRLPLPLDTFSFVFSGYHLTKDWNFDWYRRPSICCLSRFRRQVKLDNTCCHHCVMLGFGELKAFLASCTVAGQHLDAQCHLSCMLRAVMLSFFLAEFGLWIPESHLTVLS